MGPGFESLKVHQKVSVTSVEGPPVPIPNTEVKLNCAENTWLATARINRSMLTRKQKTEIVGVISSEGPPVPIPNTAVKLT